MTFPLGQIVATPAAIRAMEQSGDNARSLLSRHAQKDWGDICAEDWNLNDKAVIDGSRILSAYTLSSGEKVWVITEAADDHGHRAATTLLLPSEY